MMKKVQGHPFPLGVTVEEDRVNFSVSVPAGKECILSVYKAGEEDPAYTFDMKQKEGMGEIRFLALESVFPGEYEYAYRTGEKIWVDPFAKELTYTEDAKEKKNPLRRGRLVNRQYDWEGDRRLYLPYHEVIAYSLHIKGFTKHRSSGVKHKGTFRGVIEKIPYLKELGINQIQCMPVYEFAESAKGYTNYWGYGPGYFFAPKASYAAGNDAVAELKDMVKECHRAGIEVILEMPFDSEILPQTALECLRYYMLEYHVDGFLVNPYHVPWEMLQKDPLLKDGKILCKDDGFQNVMRRFLKGDEGMIDAVIWALRHCSREDGKCNYITSHNGFTLWDLVSYDGKHNEANGEKNQDGPDYNYSWNCGAEGPSRKKSVIQLRKNQVRNAFYLLLTAQGTPCLLSGDEFYNSQKGNNNVYCQDNELAWLNWGQLKTDASLFRYVKELIALRKAHSSIHREEAVRGIDRTACGIPDVSYHGENAWQVQNQVSSRQLGVLYCDEKEEDICFAAYNMHWLKHTFALPALTGGRKWYRVFYTCRKEQEEKLLEDQRTIELEERTVVFLVGK
nr:alpha-amylase family glycosyl hydrolase [Mediterraneibacter massiliensis]